MKKTFVVIIIVIIAALFFWFLAKKGVAPEPLETGKNASPSPSVGAITNGNKVTWVAPISNARERITKKPFDIFVSPADSPVSPEKFTGYHTGVDFEIFSGEENSSVSVYAICSGPLLEKITASGYGGVAVQKCELNNQPVTVVYGHVKLSSIVIKSGQQLKAGDKLAVLGEGFSAETGGERKHLHIGIHKGAGVELRGYVQNPDELTSWINLADYIR